MPDPIAADVTRRRFLRTAGAAGLALGAASLAGAAEPLAPPDKQPPNLDVPAGKPNKVGWALVGLGVLTLDEIMPAFGAAEHSRPVALVSGHRDKAEKVAAFYGMDPAKIYNYENFRERIAADRDVGAVYNVLPNHLHAKVSIEALEAGKDVLCEKPMTGTLADARALLAAQQRTGRKLMIAYRLRYEPTHWRAVNLIRDGAIGKVRVVETHNLQTTNAPNIRLSNETQGGPLGDVGVYCLQACRYLTGLEPTEVSGVEVKPASDERFREVPESVLFQLKMPGDVTCMAACGFGSARSSRVRVVGDKGWLEIDPGFSYRGLRLKLFRNGEMTELEVKPTDQFAKQMDYFSDCILKDKVPYTPGEEGMRDMLICDAITRSAREANGAFVKVPELPALPGEGAYLAPPASTRPSA